MLRNYKSLWCERVLKMVYEFDLKTASTDRQIDLVYELTKAV